MTEKKTNETNVYAKSASYLQDRELIVRTSAENLVSLPVSPEPGNEPNLNSVSRFKPTRELQRELDRTQNRPINPQLLDTPLSKKDAEAAGLYSGGARKQIPSRKKSQKKKRSRKSKKN